MFLLAVLLIIMPASADYWSKREEFIRNEKSFALGSNIILTEQEQQVNHLLMKYKKNEVEEGFEKPATYPAALHFFKAKEQIEKSLVFSILKQMPKGAILHAHDLALLSPQWIVKNVTYRDNLYTCEENGTWKFRFSMKPPGREWKSVKVLRRQACSEKVFDEWLESLFTLEVPDPEVQYSDINLVWNAFMNIFIAITPLLTYKPVFEDYFYAVLQHLYDDNVIYMEMRGTLPDLYEANGEEIKGADSVEIMYTVNKKFLESHPDHMGMKFIYAPPRKVGNNTMEDYVKIYKDIKLLYPDFIIGFDLVGQEDSGQPLCEFVNEFREYDPDTKFFFHAGETNWYGMPTDMNLIDAVLLNTTRIGHGYALTKHPKVLEEVKKRDIAIEVNPISNQVLMLVKDVRNHPGITLLSQDYPVVISCDDPGYWGANMLSHDFYMAFMGMCSADDDLKFLKQLILNSLKYSVFSEEERKTAMKLWEDKWNSFLSSILNQHTGKPDIHNNTI